MFNEEEKQLARKGAEMAEAWLPRLRSEMEELKQRIDWHERNLNIWHSLTSPTMETLTLLSPFTKQERARRGSARAHIFTVLEDGMAGESMSDVQKEVEARFGINYPASTIYRNIEAFKKKEEQSQEAA